LLSAAWQGSTTRAQFNMIDGSSSGAGPSGGMGKAFGAWADASLIDGHVSQSFGAIRMDPGLTWGNQLITNDVQGGYYQFGYQSRRWFADVGVDQAWSVSGRGLDTTFVTADGRYQLSRDLGAGGTLNIRRSSGPVAWSLGSYVDVRNDSGIGRGQLNYVNTDAGRDIALSVSQGWSLPNTMHFSTALGYERISDTSTSGAAAPSSAINVSVNGSIDLSARLSVDGNINWDRAIGGQRASSLMADVALNWQIAREWTLLASYYENRTGAWTAVTVASPLAPPSEIPISSVGQRAVFFSVRYQRSAGRHFAPLGGGPGSGSGRLTGAIYLDANDNGQFDAGEGVASNVTVVLDSRYSTITDSKGRFDFPAVVAGHHVISVVPDNLPLPWSVIGDGRVDVDVKTRDHTDISIAVSRHPVLVRQPE